MNRLTTDRIIWTIVQAVLDRQRGSGCGTGFDPTLVVSDSRYVVDYQTGTGHVLLDRFGLQQRFSEAEARTITAWHLGSIDPDFAVVDLQPRARGE